MGQKGSPGTLGIHLVGPHATDLVAEASLAFQLDATPPEIGGGAPPPPPPPPPLPPRPPPPRRAPRSAARRPGPSTAGRSTSEPPRRATIDGGVPEEPDGPCAVGRPDRRRPPGDVQDRRPRPRRRRADVDPQPGRPDPVRHLRAGPRG